MHGNVTHHCACYCEAASIHRGGEELRFKILDKKKKTRVQTRQAFHILCWMKTFFSHRVLVAKILQQPSGELSDLIS